MIKNVLNDYPITVILISINISIFAVLNILVWNGIEFSSLVQDYIGFNEKAFHGEYWRFFTSLFVHVEFEHIFGNSLGLLAFGTLAERYFGRCTHILFYLSSGLLASIYNIVGHCGVDILFDANNCNNLGNSFGIGYGASGCIFGLVGMLLVYSLSNTERLFYSSIISRFFYGTSMLVYIVGALIIGHGLFSNGVVSALWGFGSPSVGFMEHTHGGGFITGILLSLLIMALRSVKVRPNTTAF
jgi:rhomboid protease GluP